jgi:peptide/nickel transport system permease protein
MGLYLARRFALVLPTLLGASVVTFLLLHWMPGDAAEILAGEHASPEIVSAIRHDLKLDRPLAEQYLFYLAGLLKGDLGLSSKTHEPIRQEIVRYLPATIELTLAALLLACSGGIGAGLLAARRPGGWIDATSTSLASVGVSMPIFWLALVLMHFFGVKWPLLPVSGREPALFELERQTGFILLDSALAGNSAAFLAGIHHLILPAVVLSTVPLAVIARVTRSSVLEALGRDYIRTARAKGLDESAVLLRHAVRNGMLPTLTVVGLQFGSLLGGAVITETVFSWPGIGRWMLLAVEARDARVLQAGVLLMALSFAIVNLVTDLLYGMLDPRIKLE